MSLLNDIIFAIKVRRIKRRAVFDMAHVSPRTDRMLIGDVVKQYGPYRLHKLDLTLKGGRIVNSGRYFVVAGEVSVPLAIAMRTDSKDPHGYQMIVKRRKGPLRNSVHIGDVSIERSSDRDIYIQADNFLAYRQMAIERFKEELRAAWDKSTGNARRARFYRTRLAEMEAEQRIMSEALRAFVEAYPEADTAATRHTATDEREVRWGRRRMQRGIALINEVYERHAHHAKKRRI